MEKYIVNYRSTVKSAIEHMEKVLVKAVIVVDDDMKVLGIFTNGDMRSFFLKNGQLSDAITMAMNKEPMLYASEDEVYEERKERLRVIYPIVDCEQRLINVLDFESSSNQYGNSLENIPLVIMAGGKGTRLYPYTKILPKPLIPIGNTTITERIIESFTRYGCRKVLMILNYKANMIRSYMEDVEKDYEIEYLQEDEFLGTAGGLRLIKDKVGERFFLSNRDVLVESDFGSVLRNHIGKKNDITFICSMKNMIIPYGVIKTDENGYIKDMTEKPDYSFMVNTGVYLVDTQVINHIKENEYIHMPDLARRIIDNGGKSGVYPISERAWMDMGQFSEMEDMKRRLGL